MMHLIIVAAHYASISTCVWCLNVRSLLPNTLFSMKLIMQVCMSWREISISLSNSLLFSRLQVQKSEAYSWTEDLPYLGMARFHLWRGYLLQILRPLRSDWHKQATAKLRVTLVRFCTWWALVSSFVCSKSSVFHCLTEIRGMFQK